MLSWRPKYCKMKKLYTDHQKFLQKTTIVKVHVLVKAAMTSSLFKCLQRKNCYLILSLSKTLKKPVWCLNSYTVCKTRSKPKKKLNKNKEEYPPCSNTKLVISELWIQSSLTFFFTSPMLCSFKLHDCSFHWLRMCDYDMQFCINILNSKA